MRSNIYSRIPHPARLSTFASVIMRGFFSPASASTSASSARSASSASARAPQPRTPIVQSYDSAVADGTLILSPQGVRCKCSPTIYPCGWGPRRANEWKAHSARETHQTWARSQLGKRAFGSEPSTPPSADDLAPSCKGIEY